MVVSYVQPCDWFLKSFSLTDDLTCIGKKILSVDDHELGRKFDNVRGQ
jgi:hypothetical protein